MLNNSIVIFHRENTAEGRLNQVKENIKVDALYGFHRVTDVRERIGFLINMHTVIHFLKYELI